MEKILFKKLDSQKIQCLACNHYCQILPNRAGLCAVRKNCDGRLKLLVDNKVISLSIDPIEKKPLCHFLPGTEIMSLGTLGCNLRCHFCQNFDISQFIKTQSDSYLGQTITAQEIVSDTIKYKLPSIAYTYNEPTVFVEFALRVMKLARQKGLKNVWVSNGYMSKETLDTILPFLDAINIDLKSFSEDFYRKICGGHLKPVLKNIKRIYDSGVHLELTTLLIPGANDSDQELSSMAQFIKSISPKIPWHLSRFFPTYKMLDRPPTPIETLKKAETIAHKAGLRQVHLGNI